MNPFAIDVHEPREIAELCKPVIPTMQVPLNSQGKADYYWIDIEGNHRQWERKQIGEILTSVSSVEGQLNEEMITGLHLALNSGTKDEMNLVVEGIAMPTMTGVQCYRLSKDRRFWVQAWEFSKQRNLYTLYEMWKASARLAGINVIETPHWEVTAKTLISAYKESMKEERTTFKRYLNPHLPPFSPNPHVDNLIRLKGTGVGEVLAIELVKRHKTLWNVLNASANELLRDLPGVKAVKKFMKAVGRE